MLYIYNLACLPEAAQEAFITVADRAGEGVCIIGEQDLDKTVAEALETLEPADIGAFAASAQEEGAPFLLMDIDDLEIDALLAQLRKHEVRIGHKCMVTKKNRHWKLRKLIGDVAEEHAMMSQLMTVQQMLEASKDFKEADYAPMLWMAYMEKRHAAEDLLAHVGKVPVTTEAVKATATALNQAVMALIVSRGGKS